MRISRSLSGKNRAKYCDFGCVSYETHFAIISHEMVIFMVVKVGNLL